MIVLDDEGEEKVEKLDAGNDGEDSEQGFCIRDSEEGSAAKENN